MVLTKKQKYQREYYQKNKAEIKEYHKQHYQKNKERHNEACKQYYRENKDKIKKYHQEYFRRKKARINEWLLQQKKTPCSICGLVDHRVIEFHHPNGIEKREETPLSYQRYNFPRLKKELAKCVPLCANCHKIVHYEKRNKE